MNSFLSVQGFVELAILLLATASSVAVCFARSFRVRVLWLWFLGFSLGTYYLFRENELLALFQWILSSLVPLGLAFFGVLFGEFQKGRVAVRDPSRSLIKEYFRPKVIFGLFVTLGLAAAFALLCAKTANTIVGGSPRTASPLFSGLLESGGLPSAMLVLLLAFFVILGASITMRIDRKENSDGQ